MLQHLEMLVVVISKDITPSLCRFDCHVMDGHFHVWIDVVSIFILREVWWRGESFVVVCKHLVVDESIYWELVVVLINEQVSHHVSVNYQQNVLPLRQWRPTTKLRVKHA